MRRLWPIWVAVSSIAWGQGQQPSENLFQTVRPQVLMTVRRDPNGSRADLIEVRTIDPQYPVDQLRAQIIELGRLLGSEPRGLLVARSSITGSDASMTTIKGSCAVDNLIDRGTRNFHLTEIARAFAGYAPPHEVTGISLMFIGEAPTRDTLLAFGSKEGPVQVQGMYDPTIQGIQYRLRLNTQKPDEILIPEGPEQKPAEKTSSVAGEGVDWLIWGPIAASALAVGALVYSLLVRSTSSRQAKGKN
jgi:hypothetical protein